MPPTIRQFSPADRGPRIILLDLQSTLSANFRKMGTNPTPARIISEEEYKPYLVDWLRKIQRVGWIVAKKSRDRVLFQGSSSGGHRTTSTWGDLRYELYVKQKIEQGIADVEARRVVPHDRLAELLDGES